MPPYLLDTVTRVSAGLDLYFSYHQGAWQSRSQESAPNLRSPKDVWCVREPEDRLFLRFVTGDALNLGFMFLLRLTICSDASNIFKKFALLLAHSSGNNR